jgi:hypothetical protein
MAIEQCLSLILAAGTGAMHIPLHVQELSKARIKNQFETQFNSSNHSIRLLFDNPDCPFKGDYWYNPEAIVLNADSKYLRGRISVSLNDVLANTKIDFSSVALNSPQNKEDIEDKYLELYNLPLQEKSSNEIKPLWPWILGGILGIGSTYVAYRIIKQKQNKKEDTSDSSNEPPQIPNLRGSFQF